MAAWCLCTSVLPDSFLAISYKTWTIPVIRYTTGIMEIGSLDRKTRKLKIIMSFVHATRSTDVFKGIWFDSMDYINWIFGFKDTVI